MKSRIFRDVEDMRFVKNKLLFLFLLSLLFLFVLPLVSSYTLKVTEEHPFLVDGKWISASELKVGDRLITADGKRARITGIKEVISEKEFPVYNLEAGVYHNFVVGPLDLIVHNSNEPKPEVPIPDGKAAPILDEAAARKWADSALTPELRNLRNRIIDYVKNEGYISFEKFMKDLDIAVQKFNDRIRPGDKYVVVALEEGSSSPWVYDLIKSKLKVPPEGFEYLEIGNGRDYQSICQMLQKYYDRGVRKFVYFDDAAYTGSQIFNDVYFRVSNCLNCNGRTELIEIKFVLAESTQRAKDIYLSKTDNPEHFKLFANSKGEIINGGDMKTISEIFPNRNDQASLKLGGIRSNQVLNYFPHKVPDAVSLPKVIADFIKTLGGKTFYENYVPPYRDPAYVNAQKCLLQK